MTVSPLAILSGDIQHWLSPIVGWLRYDEHHNTATDPAAIAAGLNKAETAFRDADVFDASAARLVASVQDCIDVARAEITAAASSNRPVNQLWLIDVVRRPCSLANETEDA